MPEPPRARSSRMTPEMLAYKLLGAFNHPSSATSTTFTLVQVSLALLTLTSFSPPNRYPSLPAPQHDQKMR